MKTNITMTQHITEFVTKAEQITDGIIIQDDLLSIILLGLLSTKYENLIVMESRDVLPPLESVSLKQKLIEEEARQSD